MSMTAQLLIGLSLKSVTLPEILTVCCAKAERLAKVIKRENKSFISNSMSPRGAGGSFFLANLLQIWQTFVKSVCFLSFVCICITKMNPLTLQMFLGTLYACWERGRKLGSSKPIYIPHAWMLYCYFKLKE